MPFKDPEKKRAWEKAHRNSDAYRAKRRHEMALRRKADPELFRRQAKDRYRRRVVDPTYVSNRKHQDAEWQRRLRLEVFSHYSGGPPACSCCGESAIPFLTLDHVEGDGAVHRRKMGGRGKGIHFYAWLRRNGYPDNIKLRVLCWNCNCARRLGECPHSAARPA